jgi:hypothetical protein
MRLAVEFWAVLPSHVIQGVPAGKFNIVGDHSIGHSKQKIVYVRMSYSERFHR